MEDRKGKIIALIVVMSMPIVLIFWWIPHCDAIGVQKAQHRTAGKR
jgi:hypothetical protein